MRLSSFLPSFLRPILRPVYRDSVRLLRRLTHRHRSRENLLEYWKNPTDVSNLPHHYLEPKAKARSEFLLRILGSHGCSIEHRILEIGCNAGRNLHYLWNAGYKNLSGIEISQNAIMVLREQFPDMAEHIGLYNAPVEEVIRGISDGRFDVVFTMAVLEHIHSESEWIFREIARITKCLLVSIEDEKGEGLRHFARNYKKIFEPFGMLQSEAYQCNPETAGLGSTFVARVFRKSANSQ
jgi:SAM-dependent methyltransferase